MIKVLLVDDEQFIRQGLRRLVDWEKYGYEIVAEAENGLDAIRVLEETDVNLVFIDIRMPGMTGIEVISYVREHMKRRVQFVILTGYADFDYAKTAMRLNVSDYMLKPIQEKELLEVLMKLNGEYQQAQQTQREKYDFHMAQLLHGNFMEESVEWIRTFLEPAEEWKYVSFEFDKGCREFLALEREEKARQQKLLTGYLISLMGKKEYHVVPMLETEEDVFGAGLLLTKQLCADKDMKEAEYLDSFQKRVNCHFEYRIQIYAGQGVESLTQLPVSFR